LQIKGDIVADTKKLCVALLAGGKSGEREVSLSGAAIFEKALDPDKYLIKRYDPAYDLQYLARDSKEIDFAFILLHGLFGEDGSVQGMLDLLDIPYQGSGILGSAVAMDKNLAKILYRTVDIPVADWRIVDQADEAQCAEMIAEFGLPLVIKPVRDGSSLGLTIARTEEQVVSGVEQALKNDHRVMVEKFIKGREITVSVLGNDDPVPLPVIEIIPGEEYEFFDYNAKYLPGASKEICPAQIDPGLAQAAQRYGVAAHKVLQLSGYSRTDMIIDEDNALYILETNTIPGMTETSLFPQAAKEFGLDYPRVLERLIELGIEAQKTGRG
jgi:D-alanine-D-alanine ligase